MNRFLHRIMGHFLMSDDAGAAGGGTDAGAAAGADAAAAAADPAKTSVTQQPTLLTDNKADSGDAGAAAEDGGAKDGEQAKDQAQGAPEAYEAFTFAEGFEMDKAVGESFQALAKELNLSQADAQRLVDLQNQLESGKDQARRDYLENLLAEQRTRWVNELRNDPEFGGENFDSNVGVAMKAMEAFGDEDLRVLLNESGIGNSPAVVKLFHRIGKAISEDSIVMPGASSKKIEPKRAAEVLFPGLD